MRAATSRSIGRATAQLAASVCLLFTGQAHAAAGAVGERAPEYDATTLADESPVSVADLRGTAVLLNKWSTWCKPCVEEMPFLDELHDRYRDRDFTVVGASIDRPGAEGNVARLARERGVDYPIWLDPEDLFTQTFRSTGVPESVLIDKNGVVVRRWPGALSEDDKTIHAAIDRAIASEGGYVEKARTENKEASGVEFGIVGITAVILAGILSFLSPCVLPLVPSYVAFLAGVGGIEQSHGARRRTTMVHALAFVVGFSLVFVLLGISATAVGGAFRESGVWIERVGGAMLLVFGLVLLGAIPLAILQREARLLERVRGLRRFGPLGSGIVGAAFAAGWTPCIGPVLAGILALAATSEDTAAGITLLIAYSAGLAIPFLAAAFAIDRFNIASPGMRRWLPWINRISGALLIALGVLLLTGAMTRLSGWFAQFTPSWLG